MGLLFLQILLVIIIALVTTRRQQEEAVQGGIDFSGCQEDPETGLCCVEKEETVTSLEKEPILECTHKNVEQCHYTYVTQFTPSQEEVCEENFEKQCSITFKQQAYNETVKKCYKPVAPLESLTMRRRLLLPPSEPASQLPSQLLRSSHHSTSQLSHWILATSVQDQSELADLSPASDRLHLQ